MSNVQSPRNLLREINRLTTSHSVSNPANYGPLCDSSEESECVVSLANKSSSFYKVPSPRRKAPIAKVHVPTTEDEQYAHSIAFGRKLNAEASIPFDLEGVSIAESKDSAAVRAECISVLEMLRREL